MLAAASALRVSLFKLSASMLTSTLAVTLTTMKKDVLATANNVESIKNVNFSSTCNQKSYMKNGSLPVTASVVVTSSAVVVASAVVVS